MSIITRFAGFFNNKAKSVEPTFGGTWIGSGGGGDGVTERNLLEANKEWVYIAVHKIATSTASIRFKVMKYTRNGDDKEVFAGPLVDFLDKPGPGFTGTDFIYLNTVYKELCGNAFWERIESKAVYPLIPTLVTPDISGGKLVAYKYTGGATERKIATDKVLHDRYIDPSRPYWGVGKLQKIAGWVDTSNYANEILKSFFLNGAVFGGFITTEEETEERIKLIKLGVVNDHTGVKNAHKMGVLPKGSDYKPAMAKMRDMEMGETDDRYRDKILAGFGVPKTLVGLTTEVNRASAEASEYIFALYTIKPIVDDLISFLNVNVAAVIDPSGQFYFDYDEFVPENMEMKLKEQELALNKQPYKTVNEVRADAGLPPVQGGDIVYGNPGQVPLGEPAPAPEPAAAPKDDKNPKQPAKALPRGISGRIRAFEKVEESKTKVADDLVKAVEVFVSKTQEIADATDHKEFVGRVDSHRDRLEQAVRDYNARQHHSLLGRLTTITKDLSTASTKDINGTDLWDMESEVSLMVDVVSPILGSLLTEQALAEYEAQAFPGYYKAGDVLTQQVAVLAAKRLASSYNTTTAKLLTGEINEGMQAGDSLQQLVKRVKGVYEFSDEVRAKAVAHTESFYIANKANLDAYRQSGVVKSMRWYTAEDELVCPHCGPMNGRTIPLDQSFYKKGDTTESGLKLDYRSMDVPPLHTNCRCFIRPGVIEVEV